MLGKVRFDESITLKEDYVSWSKQKNTNKMRIFWDLFLADGWTDIGFSDLFLADMMQMY